MLDKEVETARGTVVCKIFIFFRTGAGGGAEESVEAVPIARQDTQASPGGGGVATWI